MSGSTGIYRDDTVRARMRELYDRFVARLPQPPQRETISTSFGETRTLIYGPSDAPPLVCLHGAMAGAPHALFEIKGLFDGFRVHAPDIVGQSIGSAEVRPSFSADGFGTWIAEVMDGLGLPRAHILGVSWGGAVALQAAIHHPRRVDRLALLCPAGIVRGSAWRAAWEVGWPMLRWRLSPSQARLEAVLRSTLTTLDPLWTELLGLAFRGVKMDFSAPPLAAVDQLHGFDRPTMVIAAEHDLSFPAQPLVARSRELFPGLAQTHVIPGSKHCPPFDDDFRRWLESTLRDFFSPPRSPAGAI